VPHLLLDKLEVLVQRDPGTVFTDNVVTGLAVLAALACYVTHGAILQHHADSNSGNDVGGRRNFLLMARISKPGGVAGRNPETL
jgi:hypothetical protein